MTPLLDVVLRNEVVSPCKEVIVGCHEVVVWEIDETIKTASVVVVVEV